MMNKIAFFVAILLIVYECHSGESDMIADRPGYGESAYLVTHGRVHVETGVIYSKNTFEDSDSEEINVATTVIRIGVLENAELRFSFQYTSLNDKIMEKTTKGFGGVGIGTKIHIVKEERWMPEACFVYNLKLPIGGKEFRSEELASNFRLAMEKTLSNGYALASNIGIDWDAGTPELMYSISLGYELQEDIALFLEYYGESKKLGKTDHVIDGGFAYNLMGNVQLDASFGYALTDWTADYFLSAGVSFRLPG